MVERNVDSRPKTQLNGAVAPFCFSPETQSWCVIKQKAQHFVRSLSEKRDHTQENRERNRKKNDIENFYALEVSGGQKNKIYDLTQES